MEVTPGDPERSSTKTLTKPDLTHRIDVPDIPRGEEGHDRKEISSTQK